MSLLTLVQGVCKALGKTPPSAAITSSDETVAEIVLLCNISGTELARQNDFPELLVDNTFSATASVNQGFLIGSSATAVVSACDYERMVPDTFYDRTADRKVIGPITPAEWAQLKASGSQPVNHRFMIVGGQLYVGPVTGPTSGNTLAFFYYSNKFCQSSSGTNLNAWAADTDVSRIPESIMRLDVIWRWKQSKGMAYAEDMETAERAINQYTGAAPGRRLLMLGGGGGFSYVTNIPEGNWG